MRFVIISYRKEYDETRRSCLHGPTCVNYTSSRSNVELCVCKNTEEAATYLADRVHQNRCAPYCHFIFARWEDIANPEYIPEMDADPAKENKAPLGRIRWPMADEFDEDNNRDPNYDETVNSCIAIERLATQKLAELNKIADQKRILKEQEKETNRKATDIANKRRLYEELKNEFEPK